MPVHAAWTPTTLMPRLRDGTREPRAEVQALGIGGRSWNLWLSYANLSSPVNLSSLCLLSCKMDIMCPPAGSPAGSMRNAQEHLAGYLAESTPRLMLVAREELPPCTHPVPSCYCRAPGHVRGRAHRVTDTQSSDSSGKKEAHSHSNCTKPGGCPGRFPSNSPFIPP